jgi:uncharacterized protein YecE (DUF72 family)
VATLYAGTSGYAYPTWKPDFYPEDLPSTRFLRHYAGRLNCVEVNYTFRHMPSEKTVTSWIESTPPGFLFAVKAHQTITHANRLKEGAREPTEYFLDKLRPLQEAGRLGPVLLQLPPNLKLDLDRLTRFLELLPRDLRFTFEFRNTSWFASEVYDVLRRYGASLCVAESDELVVPDVVTAGFAYYRLRKPPYDELALTRLRRRAGELLDGGRDVYLVFKHEEDAGGALEAERLLAA